MKTYLRLLRCLYPYRITVSFTWLLSLLIVGLQVLSVLVGAIIVERILAPAGSTNAPGTDLGWPLQLLDHFIRSLLQASSAFRSLVISAIILLCAQISISALRIVKQVIFARVTQSILMGIRLSMFQRLTECDLAFHRRYRHGETASLFLMDVDQLQNGFVDSTDRLFMQPIRMCVGIGLMVLLSWRLTVCVLAVLVAAAIFIHVTGKLLESKFQAVSEKRATLQGHLVEYLSTVIIARSLGREKYERKRFAARCRDLKDTFVQATVIGIITPSVVSAIFLAAGAVILIWCGYQVFARGTMSSAVVVRMTLVLPMVTYSLEALASISNSIRSCLASAKRVFAFLDQEAPWCEAEDAMEPQRFQKAIELDHVGYVLEGNRIIEDISFVIPRGAVVVIYGPSGAGKSTILSLLAAFAHCTSGAIFVDGVDIRQLRASAWRRHLGIVPQDCILLNASIRENIAYAKPDATDAEVLEALRQAGIGTNSPLLRNGLDTVVGNRGEMLSGGERQRLTIARALVNQPSILLLDEPTSMLDYENKILIEHVIQDLARDRTIVVASHDLLLRDIADIAIGLDEGKTRRPDAEDLDVPVRLKQICT